MIPNVARSGLLGARMADLGMRQLAGQRDGREMPRDRASATHWPGVQQAPTRSAVSRRPHGPIAVGSRVAGCVCS